jgi:HAD superfamily hydrolase (TIGR01509 family)
MDGTLYDKTGIAQKMVKRLWWCLPMLASERLARRNMHYVQYASSDEFFSVFFRQMARGHWWGPNIAAKWYNHVYLPTMVKIITQYYKPREDVMKLVEQGKARGLKMAIYSDYGAVREKLAALGIDAGQFDVIVAAPELGALKPSEPCARRMLEMLEAEPDTTLFVGDREDKDGASANAVGAMYLKV